MQLKVQTRLGRAGLLVVAMGCLVTGIWGGLLRLPLALPLPVEHANWITYHGPLMVCGFLGTVIGLERAVGLRALWTYAAPLLTGAGSVAIAAGVLGMWPRWTLVAGSAVFVAVAARVVTIQRATHTLVMGGGGLLWLGGNFVWALGGELPQVVPWWIGFLLLTILGERIELTRFQRPSPLSKPWLLIALSVLGGGLGAGFFTAKIGGWLVGLSMLGFGLWFVRFDIARRNLRNPGLPRFMAVCLLTGYGWLLAGAAIMLATWPQTTGFKYDAALHAFFVGFVFSMIFGHAPVIFPSVLGLPVSFRPSAYVPLLVLHLSVLLRVLGDLMNWSQVRVWGGAGNGIAVGLFVLNMVATMLLSRAASQPAAPKGAVAGSAPPQ